MAVSGRVIRGLVKGGVVLANDVRCDYVNTGNWEWVAGSSLAKRRKKLTAGVGVGGYHMMSTTAAVNVLIVLVDFWGRRPVTATYVLA